MSLSCIIFQFIFVVAVSILTDIIQLGVYFKINEDANGDGESRLYVTPITMVLILILSVYSCGAKNVELFSWVCAPRSPLVVMGTFVKMLIHMYFCSTE